MDLVTYEDRRRKSLPSFEVKPQDMMDLKKIVYEDDTFRLVDICDALPLSEPWRQRKSDIKYAVLHQTYGNILNFPDGVLASNRYCINHHGWPGVPYHIYVPYRPLRAGKLTAYYINRYYKMTWHTYGGNTHGIGFVMQGKFHGNIDPTPEQKEATQKVWYEVIKPSFGFGDEDLMGHFSFGKTGCPGPWGKQWVLSEQDGYGYMIQ
jgi:hypothetical protein